MLPLQRSLCSYKVLVCACLMLAVLLVVSMSGVRHMTSEDWFGPGLEDTAEGPQARGPGVEIGFVDNSGAVQYLEEYQNLFTTDHLTMTADPNNPKTITTWWQAAAMIDWYINTPLRYRCRRKITVGNWHICQDSPFTVKPPCLVYSFGINFDFSFDDAMARIGCEVHSFDPSMKMMDHKRRGHSTFHNMGLGSYNTNAYIPRADTYVTNNQTWKMRTAKAVMKELGHENRVIDVFKMDIEGYEWAVLANMMETGVFRYIRQFMLEIHLFPDFPLKQDYVYIYTVYTKLREMGFREFTIGPHPKNLEVNAFNNQGDVEFVNVLFSKAEMMEDRRSIGTRSVENLLTEVERERTE
ncbi:hypothetical protein BsWGS_09307 [Bradybaena similaris]